MATISLKMITWCNVYGAEIKAHKMELAVFVCEGKIKLRQVPP